MNTHFWVVIVYCFTAYADTCSIPVMVWMVCFGLITLWQNYGDSRHGQGVIVRHILCVCVCVCVCVLAGCRLPSDIWLMEHLTDATFFFFQVLNVGTLWNFFPNVFNAWSVELLMWNPQIWTEYIYVCVCVYVYMCVCIYICVCMYIYI